MGRGKGEEEPKRRVVDKRIQEEKEWVKEEKKAEERKGGPGKYASQLMMSMSAMESADESVRVPVVHKVPS